MRLSILICSLESRKGYLFRLVKELYTQLININAFSVVEILIEMDNKQITTGEKRNKLLDRANGDYVCFIDDDDIVYSTYISSILKATESNPDCVATCGHYSINGGEKTKWMLSKNYEDKDLYVNGEKILFRRANHLTPVKREHALKARFPNISNAEDKAYSAALNKYLITETVIDEPIYHYEYSTANKEY